MLSTVIISVNFGMLFSLKQTEWPLLKTSIKSDKCNEIKYFFLNKKMEEKMIDINDPERGIKIYRLYNKMFLEKMKEG